MNKLFLKRIVTLMLTGLLFSSISFSQVNADFLRSAPADGVKFIQAYITPWANAFGAGLNGSWYNSAKPHKLGGFDVTLGFNVGMAPSSDETFDLSSLGLSSNLSPTTGSAPSIAGPKTPGPEMTYSITDATFGTVPLATFNTPRGTNWKLIPVPTLQAGVGLPLGTEIKLRFIPRLPIKDGDVSLWGIGLMHSIMQYIPGSKLLPLDASVFAGYTRLTGNVPLTLMPETGVTQNFTAINPVTAFNDQFLSATISALNISAIASVNLPVISFYGGLGYSNTRTTVELTGKFPTPGLNMGNGQAEYTDSGVLDGTDFPKIDIPSFSGLRANVGFRIKLAVITIHADYTRAQYNVISSGLGISFR